MRIVIGCMALLAGGLFTGSAGRADEPAAGDKHEKILKQMSGTWKIVAGSNQGRKLTEEHLDGSRVMIKENTIVVLDPEEKELYKAKFQVDTSTTPYHIDMTSDMPKFPKSQAGGIFEFRQDGWRLCYGLPGAQRPQKFASPEGSQLMLFTMVKVDTTQDDKVSVKPIKDETIKEHKKAQPKNAAPKK